MTILQNKNQNLLIKKADQSNTLIAVDKYYCNTLVIKQRLNTSTYQKVDSNSDKRVFNNLKFLRKQHESCLPKNEIEYI